MRTEVRPENSTLRGRSIRTRLLILLIGAAVVPLFIAFAVGQISTRLVGNRLTAKTQADLLDIANTRMLQSAQSAARLAGSEAQQINLVAILQARAAAQAIDHARATGTTLSTADVFLARDDFDGARRTIPGLETLPDGRTVSFETQSIVLAPGVEPAIVGVDIAALQAMAPTYPALRESNPELIESQYSATATGVHASYPGHGGYPAEFDPRLRPWYRVTIDNLARNTDGPGRVRPEWGSPLVDAASGRVVISVTMPIILRDGTIAGVTAVDMVLRHLIEHFERQPSWTANERLMIVRTPDAVAATDAGLEIWAQSSYDAEGKDWRSRVALEAFRFDDPSLTRQLVDAVTAGTSGVMRGTRNSQDILCAFAPIIAGGQPTQSVLVFTIPFDDVVAVADTIDREFWSIIVAQLTTNLAIVAIVLGAVVLFALRFSARLTRPVQELVQTVDLVANGDLDARADVRTGDELELLADDFNSMIPKLSDRLKLRESLDLAMEVQQSLLPKAPPVFPGFDIQGKAEYCDETGGDYYDYLMVDRASDTRLAIAMGDVTGHGIAAALLMTTARALVRSRAGVPGSLADHITQINALLSADNDHGRFLTLFFMVIDRTRGAMDYVAAGHDPAIIYDPATDSFRELDAEGGIPLGIDGNWAYQEHSAPILAPGEVMFLGTDGIWEARDATDALFGKERMREVIRATASRTAAQICDAVLEAVRAYRGAVPQLDDITMVVVKAV